MTEPVYSSGVTTSTFMIGSSSTEPPFCSASRNAARDAISKASTDESTSWKAPSMSVALTIDDREAGENAGRRHDCDALVDAGDIFLRHRAADDLALELIALAGFVRLENDLDARELAGAAGLLLMRVVDFDACASRRSR